MAKILNFESEILNGLVIKPEHIKQTVDAFTAADAYALSISGSLDMVDGVISSPRYNINHPNFDLYLSGSTSYFNHVKIYSTLGSNNFIEGNQGWVLENGGSASNTIRFDSVGIGIPSPSTKLDVNGDGRFVTSLNIDHSSPSGYGTLELSNHTTGSIISANPASSNGSTINLQFRINDSEKMRIDHLGNVGVNTTSSTITSKLQVVGLPGYADNAAALSGGLTLGAFYHTAGVLKVVI
jgi:hypothetical protein